MTFSAKIIEIDNGFLVYAIDDESLITFNDINMRCYVEHMPEALSKIKEIFEKTEKMREGEKIVAEKSEKKTTA